MTVAQVARKSRDENMRVGKRVYTFRAKHKIAGYIMLDVQRLLGAVMGTSALVLAQPARAAQPADLIATNARVYTAGSEPRLAEALAVRNGHIYERNVYPARSVKAAGATQIAGSDAPVDTRDPRPFVNMQMAVTRRFPGLPALNSSEAISIAEVLDACTINGTRALGRADETGSLEAGKSADFILLDQDILALAASGDADRIGKTRVLGTWHKGHRVYNGEAR